MMALFKRLLDASAERAGFSALPFYPHPGTSSITRNCCNNRHLASKQYWLPCGHPTKTQFLNFHKTSTNKFSGTRIADTTRLPVYQIHQRRASIFLRYGLRTIVPSALDCLAVSASLPRELPYRSRNVLFLEFGKLVISLDFSYANA